MNKLFIKDEIWNKSPKWLQRAIKGHDDEDHTEHHKKILKKEKQNKFKSLDEVKPKKSSGGDPPMKFNKDWFKEHKPSVALWILIFMLATALATCSDLKVDITYEYNQPPVVKKLLGNK